jgi:hypothetical protein
MEDGAHYIGGIVLILAGSLGCVIAKFLAITSTAIGPTRLAKVSKIVSLVGLIPIVVWLLGWSR